jgi:hypothetical protein
MRVIGNMKSITCRRMRGSMKSLLLLSGLCSIVLVCNAQAGGKYEPLRGVYLGTVMKDGGSGNDIALFNQKAGKRHAVYTKFVDFKEGFPADWVTLVKTGCPGAGVHITLEPQTEFPDFFSTNWAPGHDTYDKALAFATNCASAGLPIFLRFAHEPNGWWYPWAPSYLGDDQVSNDTYVVGWRNFANLVHSNAPNVAMVWAPNQGNGGGEQIYYGHTYPGDAYVDWVGLSLYNGSWYGNYNEVMDYEFRNAIQRGYWQENGDPADDTVEDFYWEFSDPDNPTGHHKPMMIAETSTQWRPQFRTTSEVVIASFESLIGASYQLTNETWVDPFETNTTWSWGPWENMYFSNTDVCAYGTNAALIGAKSSFVSGTYVGGNGKSITPTNWSSFNGMTLWVKRGAAGTNDPQLRIGLRSGYAPDERTASVDRVISTTSYSAMGIYFSEMTAGSGFNWSNITALTLELFTTQAGQAPPTVYLDKWQAGVLTNAPDQTWWTPWGLEVWTQTADKAVGNFALRLGGTDSNNDYYIGGSGFGTSLSERNWTSHNALVMYVKRGPGAMNVKPDPKFKITVDNDDLDSNTNYASVETRVSNTNYTEILIPFADFDTSTDFVWTNIVRLKLELFASGGVTNTPYDCYIDHLRRTSATVTNAADNYLWKGDWIGQLYSLSEEAVAHPYRVDIFRTFRNLHMINWFQVRKFEDGETRDFTMLEFSGATPVYSSYYARISDEYFLTNIVVDTDGDGLSDAWELRYFNNPTNANPADDPDEDGMLNWQEYVSGTHPSNDLSVFKMGSPYNSDTISKTGFVIRWSSETGQVYSLDRSTNLVAGSFPVQVSNLVATPPINAYTDAVTGVGPYFYRVKALP